MTKSLDQLDRAILFHLQENARITNSELAQRVQLSPPGLQKRLRKLEDAGIINRYVTLVDRGKVGFDLLFFIQLSLKPFESKGGKDFMQALEGMPEVLECYHTTGELDYLLKVVAADREHLEQFLAEKLTTVPGIARLTVSMVLTDVKATTALPIDCWSETSE
jgi:DNA-binding Lrp family transcriptional regulator